MTIVTTSLERTVADDVNTSTDKSVFYLQTVNQEVDDGNWTTLADFRVLEGGGVDLDELIAHL